MSASQPPEADTSRQEIVDARTTATKVAAALESFSRFYDRQLDAMKWVGAFALGGVLGLFGSSSNEAVGLKVAQVVSAAALIFSFIVALLFYWRYIGVARFLHTAETRLDVLKESVARALENDADLREDDQRLIAEAKESLAGLKWPAGSDVRADDRLWRLCLFSLAGGVLTLTLSRVASLNLF